jgi:hypothetical protein
MGFSNHILRFALSIAFVPISVAFTYEQYPLSSRLPGFPKDDHVDISIPSLFAMADIHGDYPRALAALHHAGVVDEHGDWKAGNATFVCTRNLAMR